MEYEYDEPYRYLTTFTSLNIPDYTEYLERFGKGGDTAFVVQDCIGLLRESGVTLDDFPDMMVAFARDAVKKFPDIAQDVFPDLIELSRRTLTVEAPEATSA